MIALCIKTLMATLSFHSIDKLNTFVLQVVQNGYWMHYSSFDGLAKLKLICAWCSLANCHAVLLDIL